MESTYGEYLHAEGRGFCESSLFYRFIITFVDGDEDWFVRLAQESEDIMVGRIEWLVSCDDVDNDIGFVDCQECLLSHCGAERVGRLAFVAPRVDDKHAGPRSTLRRGSFGLE
jgi:hypothetical protein